MGDRTPIEVVIYSCPPESVSKVLDVFEEFNLASVETYMSAVLVATQVYREVVVAVPAEHRDEFAAAIDAALEDAKDRDRLLPRL